MALTAHVAFSAGWLGAVTAFLALAVVALVDPGSAVFAHPAAELITWSVIVPLAVASLVTGVVSSLVGPWGLLQHYWVTTKLVLTALGTGVLLLQLPTVGAAADLSADAGATAAAGPSLLLHSAGGTVLLLAITAIGIAKPRGLTRHGQRVRARAQPLSPGT